MEGYYIRQELAFRSLPCIYSAHWLEYSQKANWYDGIQWDEFFLLRVFTYLVYSHFYCTPQRTFTGNCNPVSTMQLATSSFIKQKWGDPENVSVYYRQFCLIRENSCKGQSTSFIVRDCQYYPSHSWPLMNKGNKKNKYVFHDSTVQ